MHSRVILALKCITLCQLRSFFICDCKISKSIRISRVIWRHFGNILFMLLKSTFQAAIQEICKCKKKIIIRIRIRLFRKKREKKLLKKAANTKLNFENNSKLLFLSNYSKNGKWNVLHYMLTLLQRTDRSHCTDEI